MTSQVRGRRRTAVGVVTSDKMKKTRRVEIPRLEKHPRYGKYIKRRTICYAHDETNESHMGDTVEIKIRSVELWLPIGAMSFRANRGSLPEDFPYSRDRVFFFDPKQPECLVEIPAAPQGPGAPSAFPREALRISWREARALTARWRSSAGLPRVDRWNSWRPAAHPSVRRASSARAPGRSGSA